MMRIFLVLFIAIVLFLLLGFVFYKKKEFQKESPPPPKKTIEKSSKYICDVCGEKDCICHREDNIK